MEWPLRTKWAVWASNALKGQNRAFKIQIKRACTIMAFWATLLVVNPRFDKKFVPS
jgi:hypothetical protein